MFTQGVQNKSFIFSLLIFFFVVVLLNRIQQNNEDILTVGTTIVVREMHTTTGYLRDLFLGSALIYMKQKYTLLLNVT